MKIQKTLIDQITAGNVTLFLGAGSAFGCENKKGESIPSGQELSDILSRQFLPDDYLGKPLQYVADAIISERGLLPLQQFLQEYFSEFQFSKFHTILTSFVWHSIYTTNYDKIIEEAYAAAKIKYQELVPILCNTAHIEEKFQGKSTLAYYKLHGCISKCADAKLPLILTMDQYIDYKSNRDHLYNKLYEDAKSGPILFVGYSFSDPDIRSILKLIEREDGLNRQRHWLISPKINDIDARSLESKKITTIPMTFANFLEQLNETIDTEKRKLAILRPISKHPIENKLTVSRTKISEDLLFYLEKELFYIHNLMLDKDITPKTFYKGYSSSWFAIQNKYDFQRNDQDLILTEIFLDENFVKSEETFFFLIKGYAGSGKSVFLRRLAFEAGVNLDKACFYLSDTGYLKYELIEEISFLIKERIFLFIDGVSNRQYQIQELLKKAKSNKIPITIVGTERTNVWNTDCKGLHEFIKKKYYLGRLNDTEVKLLLEKLSEYDSLGQLQFEAPEKRVEQFQKRAHNQLLVALYEITYNDNFRNIIRNEYESISNAKAKSLYLTISIFHKLGTYARAGLISRVHDINFEEFKNKFLNPLEEIVYDTLERRINDFVYRTRHRQIAEILFEEIFTNDQLIYDEYSRLINFLNIDYDSDRTVFLYLTKAKTLKRIFKNETFIDSILNQAEIIGKDVSKFFQQRAIYEMERGIPNIEKAEEYIDTAKELSRKENDPIIDHTYAEILFVKATRAILPNERERYISRCINQCKDIIKFDDNVYARHTIIKVKIYRFEKGFSECDDLIRERMMNDILSDIYQTHIRFPDDQFILDAEASFNALVDNMPAAINLLERAFNANPGSIFLAIKLSSYYLNSNDNYNKACDTIKKSLDVRYTDKDLNFHYAKLLLMSPVPNYKVIQEHLKNSFSKNDNRYFNRFLLAKVLFLDGNYPEAGNIFSILRSSAIDYTAKRKIREIIKVGDVERKFQGEIKTKDFSYGFITDQTSGEDFYFSRFKNLIDENEDVENWFDFKKKQIVNYSIGFTFMGPIAINVSFSNIKHP